MSYEAEGKGTLKINKNSFELLLTWIAKKYKEDKSDNVNEAFSKRGFGIEFDGNGNIKYANYPEGGVRLATDFLNVIEPFIEEGTKLLFVAEDGESFGWPEKTEAEMEGTIESAMFTGNFNMDDFGKIREGILNRLREKGIESDLSEDADIPDFFAWLGMPVPEIDDDLKAVVTSAYGKIEKLMDTLHVADALTEIFAVFKRLNKYIDETEPWALAKDPAKAERLSTVLYNLSEGIIIGASLLAPFLPTTAEKIAAQLGIPLRDFDQLGSFGLNAGSKVTDAPEILFARLDKAEILKKAEEVQARQRKEFLEHQEKAFANLLKAGRMTKEEVDAKWAELMAKNIREDIVEKVSHADVKVTEMLDSVNALMAKAQEFDASLKDFKSDFEAIQQSFEEDDDK